MLEHELLGGVEGVAVGEEGDEGVQGGDQQRQGEDQVQRREGSELLLEDGAQVSCRHHVHAKVHDRAVEVRRRQEPEEVARREEVNYKTGAQGVVE